ncbi:MAG: hypothetical protein DRZ82_03500 [Thermoprotei archaeon]|nr:MAG: hypothetical protein DRZ82_03500 [Thermoprotei archaeon]
MKFNVRPVVAYYSKQYSWWSQPAKEEMFQRVKMYIKRLKNFLEKMEPNIELLEPVVISSIDDLYSYHIREEVVKEADAILAINAGLGSQPVLVSLGDLGLPIVIVGFMSLVMGKSAEGFPGPEALDAYGELRRRGILVKLAVGLDDIISALRIFRCIKALRETKIIAFGTPASYIKDVITPIEYLERRMGVQIIVIALEELLNEYKKVAYEDVKERANELIKMAKCIDGFKEDYRKAIEDSIRLYIAMKNFIKRYNANAVTIDCFGFMDLIYRSVKIHRPPCIPLALLRDEGIPAACEADLDALMTMIILSILSGKPAFMGNPTYMAPHKGIIRISHCTAPLSILKEYEIVSFHESGYGATIRGYFKEGEVVTIARMAKFLSEMIITTGIIVRSKIEKTAECATRVEVRITNAREFVNKIVGDHHVMVLGDWRRELCDICDILGVRAVIL